MRQVLGALQSIAETVGIYPVGAITHVQTDEKVAGLTFDDGPHPECTPRLLDVLRRHQARATFFMVGEAARRQPHLVRQVAAEGHAVGNHSWSHPSFHTISSSERRQQIRRCQQALAPWDCRLFRPPFGHQNRALEPEAAWLGYQVVTWNLDTLDWRDQAPETTADRLVEGISPGSIVLLHDSLYSTDAAGATGVRQEAMLEAVDLALGRLDGEYRFVTVPELLSLGSPRRAGQGSGA